MIKSDIIILMADDDEEDRMLAEDAMEEAQLHIQLDFVEDGEELLQYLKREGAYEQLANQPLPSLILLDLNMPRKDGREALTEIKGDKRFRQIPVVVLTTSKAEADIIKTYELGVNSFITKPVTFDGLVTTMKRFGDYWFNTVTLPPQLGDQK